MSTSIFNRAENLGAQSFPHGLSPYDPLANDAEEFVESAEMSVFVGRNGVINIAGEIRLFKETDPIDAEAVPKFSEKNKFIQGIADILPGVPVKGILLYLGSEAPGGYGLCNGAVYKLSGGKQFITPNLPAPGGTGASGGVVYIIKLPAGAKDTGLRLGSEVGLAS